MHNGACPPNTTLPGGDKHNIAGWIAVDATDPVEFRTAMWLFENLYFGFEMTRRMDHALPVGFGLRLECRWRAGSQNGHCVAGVGYTVPGVKISTWGISGLLTDAAIAKYCDPNVRGRPLHGGQPGRPRPVDGKGSRAVSTGANWSRTSTRWAAMYRRRAHRPLRRLLLGLVHEHGARPDSEAVGEPGMIRGTCRR